MDGIECHKHTSARTSSTSGQDGPNFPSRRQFMVHGHKVREQCHGKVPDRESGPREILQLVFVDSS